MCLGAVSKHLLNSSKFGTVTTSLGCLLQCPTTLPVKNLFLISSVDLSCRSLKPFPQVLLLITREKRSATAYLLPSGGSCRPH